MAIDENSDEQPEAFEILENKRKNEFNGLYFGGVAFKYQKFVPEPDIAAEIAMKYMDVVTTGGTGTGKAANTEKLKKMKLALK